MRENPLPKWVSKALMILERDPRIGTKLPLEWSSWEEEELGCGHYGCVLQLTDAPDIVLKLTTDVSEVAFIEAALSLEYFPPGIVEYFEVLRVDMTYRKRPIYAVWRQEAESVGIPRIFEMGFKNLVGDPNEGIEVEWRDTPIFHHEYREMQQMINELMAFKWCAKHVRKVLKNAANPLRTLQEARKLEGWAWKRRTVDFSLSDGVYSPTNLEGFMRHLKGPYRLAASLLACENIAQFMHTSSRFGSTIGDAFEFYLDKGILLADVHTNNVGVIEYRDEYADRRSTTWAITDPGHAVFLTTKYGENNFPFPKRST
jgi:hypothetical protein